MARRASAAVQRADPHDRGRSRDARRAGTLLLQLHPVDRPAFLARNTQIGNQVYPTYDGRLTTVAAMQDATAVSLFATSFFDERAPAQWVTRPDASARSRGVAAQLGKADPTFESSTTPVSQKIQVAALRNVLAEDVANPAPAWVLTDYATAVDLGLTPVAIENSAGEFVLPTPESIAAGAATMTTASDGRRVPDPDAAASGAYPLTMIGPRWPRPSRSSTRRARPVPGRNNCSRRG